MKEEPKSEEGGSVPVVSKPKKKTGKNRQQPEPIEKIKVKSEVVDVTVINGGIEGDHGGKSLPSINQAEDEDTQGSNSNCMKYEKKYRKLRRYAKDMIYINAAYCDEVVHTEEEICKAKAERRYLLNRLLHRRSISAAFGSGNNSTAHSAVGTTKSSHLAKAQSLAQLICSMEKRSKKKVSSGKAGTKTTKQLLEERSKSKAKKSAKTIAEVKPKVIESLVVDVKTEKPIFHMDYGGV